MSFEDQELITHILYYLRERYFQSARFFIHDGMKRYGNESYLRLLTGICLIFEERYTEAIRDLELITDKQDVCIGAYIALSTAYKKSKMADDHDCENKVRELRKKPIDLTFYFAGMTLFLFERYEKAKEYLTRALKTTSYIRETQVMLGWVDIMSNKEKNHEHAMQLFEKANKDDNLESLLGKLKCFEVGGKYKLALEVANKLCVKHNKFLPGLLEKMHILLAMNNWDEVYDTASRCLLINSGCVEAMKLQILKVLCVEGNYEETSKRIGEFILLLDRHEPKNAYQYDRCANIFARISGRNMFILDECIKLEERALKLFPDSMEYNNGLGSLFLLKNDVRQAMKCFTKCLEQDSTNLKATMGRTACQIKENILKDAYTQLDFFNEAQANIDPSAELKYLTAVIKRKYNENQFTILNLLDEAIHMHFSQLSSMHFSTNYIYVLNPDFLLQVVQEKLSFCSEPSTPGSSSSSSMSQGDLKILKSVVNILENIIRFLPGMQKAGFLLARSYFLLGNFTKCKVVLETCMQSDQSFTEGHILMAQIHFQDGNYKLADHALEVGLSYNFSVRDNPLFHLLKGRILLKQGKAMDAKRTLHTAYSLPGVRVVPGKNKKVDNSANKFDLSSSDRLSIYLELSEALRQTGEYHESAKILQDAQTDFAGTPEETRITIRNADMAVQRGDIETAITVLRSVSSDHVYFVEARKTMAQIYLNYRHDKKLYAACFRELVERNKTPENLILLGDAYMEIQEPDKAISNYEEASRMKESDLELNTKMGLALIKTYQFAEAIKYYNKVVKSGKTSLRKDLVNLLLKLKMYDDAKGVIVRGIGELNKSNDYASNVEVVQLYLHLAKVYECIKDQEAERKQLEEAKNLQAKILKKVVMQSPEGLVAEKKLATEINHRIARSHIKSNNHQKALETFEEIRSKYNANDPETILQIARLKLLVGDAENCQKECLALLKLEDDNSHKILLKGVVSEDSDEKSYASEATMMMAELMIQRLEFDTALIHLKKLLKKEKDHYNALAILIDVLRRNGELEDVESYFKSIRENDPNQEESPGYNYCRGIYEWYMSNSSEAMKCFNIARSDGDYEVMATINMIEICINPDNDTIGGDVMEQFDQQGTGDGGSKLDGGSGIKSAISNMRTAESLWRELPKDHPRKGYLQHMIYTATKQKGAIERAMMYFTDNIKEQEKSGKTNILDNYGAAVASLMNKQLNKAKTYLSNVISVPWTKQYAEEHEKSWILLADYYIQNKMIQEANEILNDCMKYNKSCFKAYEYKGLIHEKEQNFKEAAMNYSKAWIHCDKNDPSIGYKLAFNFLKAQRYVDSIDVCLEVLKNNPKYPKIRKEILEKARISIRT